VAGCGSSPADSADPTSTEVTAEATAAPTEVEPTHEPTATPLSTFDACLADTERRPELTWIVDKTRPLPDGFVPANLVVLSNDLVPPGFEGRLLDAEAAEHFGDLVAAAAAEGFDVRTRSSYRSYDEQVWTFAYWIEQLGQEEAERVSAKPGHSEHQLGTTADVTTPTVGWALSESLGTTPEGIWLLDNAYRFGFVESYPVDGEAITGYAYEPWHLRYLGLDCAAAWYESGLTPVEFLELLADSE
jgi:D-alanyl-D-alanine carboxypeptidase